MAVSDFFAIGIYRSKISHNCLLKRIPKVSTRAEFFSILEGDAVSLCLSRKADPNELPRLLESAREDLLEARPMSPRSNTLLRPKRLAGTARSRPFDILVFEADADVKTRAADCGSFRFSIGPARRIGPIAVHP
jgi:hypothetical protein